MITGNGGTLCTYLGRPWGPFGRVVFAYTWMDACIKHVGWHNWDKPENERSACFYEYRYFMFSPSWKYLQLYDKIEINFITYIYKVMTFKTYLKSYLFNTADRVSALGACCLSQLENGLLLSFFLFFFFSLHFSSGMNSYKIWVSSWQWSRRVLEF